jgi:hypothetical protein
MSARPSAQHPATAVGLRLQPLVVLADIGYADRREIARARVRLGILFRGPLIAREESDRTSQVRFRTLEPLLLVVAGRGLLLQVVDRKLGKVRVLVQAEQRAIPAPSANSVMRTRRSCSAISGSVVPRLSPFGIRAGCPPPRSRSSAYARRLPPWFLHRIRGFSLAPGGRAFFLGFLGMSRRSGVRTMEIMGAQMGPRRRHGCACPSGGRAGFFRSYTPPAGSGGVEQVGWFTRTASGAVPSPCGGTPGSASW